MGMSFCNLHIKSKDLKGINDNILDEYVGYNISEDWISIYEKESSCDWIRTATMGRNISKMLKSPVIAINYMDDDVLQISFISKGVIIATYRNGIDGRSYKDINKVVNSFGLDKDEASILKYLVKMDLSVEKSIDLFSVLFGINLYSDNSMVNNGLEPVAKNISFLLEEIKKDKKNNKIKNITKLVLHQEIPGIRMYYFEEDKYNNIIRVAKTKDEGGYQFDNISCIQITSEGLKEVFQATYPEELFSDKYNGITIDYGFKQIDLLCKGDYHYVKTLEWDEFEPLVSKLYRVPESCLVKEEKFTVCGYSTYEDNRYLYTRDAFSNVLKKIDCVASGETVRERVDVTQFDFEKDFPGEGRWRICSQDALVMKDKLIFIVERLVDEKGFYNVVCFFDKDLKLLRSEEFPDWRYDVTLNRFAYDEETDLIYMAGRIIDLKQHKVKYYSGEFADAQFTILHKDSKGEKVIINIAGSRVLVQDTDMNILSSHKVKGHILNWYIGSNGNLNLVSAGSSFYDYTKKKDSAIRRYELKFLY